MKRIIKTGIIGFGVGGNTFHAPIIATTEGFEITRIRARKENEIKLARERYPDALITDQSDIIINDPAIDLVVIATPNSSHHPLAKQAMLAGKDVVVDKPFTITTEEADDLIAIAKQTGRVLSVHHNRRYDSDFKTIKNIIDAKLLGRLIEFESHYDRFRNYLRPGAWRENDEAGAGILYDLGSHLIDQPLFLFGFPQAITADIRIQRADAKATDNFELILHYPGLKVTLKAGMLVSQPLPRYILLGDKGSFVKYGLDVQEMALKSGLTPFTKNDWGLEPESVWGNLVTVINGVQFSGKIQSETGDYRGYYSNVYESIVNGATLDISATHARNIIRVIGLAIQSHQEKRTVDCNNEFIAE
ncbi:MAG: oxidoreductase [Bacteroidetes bacterium]|nr:oxidoreductase [Bacteroidota bacterium]